MSAEYKPATKLDFATLVDKVKEFGIATEEKTPSSCSDFTWHRLTDEKRDVFARVCDGHVLEFTTHDPFPNNPLMRQIEAACGIKMWSENDPQFWGYDTFEEMYAAPKVWTVGGIPVD